MPKHRREATIAHALALLVLMSSAVSAQSDALHRIERGDWIWSMEFPRAEAPLLGYGMGLLRGIRSACPSVRPDGAEGAFSSSWIMAGVIGSGSVGPDLAATVAGVGAARTARSVGEADGARLAGEGCASTRVKRIAENASRMVSGRRPAHGGEHLAGTLVREIVAPVRTRQITDRAIPAVTRNPRLLSFFEQDASELSRIGFQVLECHYDADPTDGDQEVQYYWAMGVASVAHAMTLLPRLVSAAQDRMARMAPGLAHHPFLDYGPPRSECPARMDPALAYKEIYAR